MTWPEDFGFTIGGHAPVIITSVAHDSIAQKSGLQPGDQIIEIENKDVRYCTSDEVKAFVKKASSYPPPLSVLSRIRGVELEYADDCRYGLRFKGSGPVYIHAVFRYSAAFELGVRPGDMLLEVNGIQVNYATHQDVEAFLSRTRSPIQIVFIPRAVEIHENGNEFHGNGILGNGDTSKPDKQMSKANYFYKIINYYVGGNTTKKINLIQSLYNYTKDRNISKLSYTLLELLENAQERQLIEHIRPYIPTNHWNKLNIIFQQESHLARHCTLNEDKNIDVNNLRPYTSLSYAKGNQISNTMNGYNEFTNIKSRIVQIQRNLDSGSLGVILQNNKPVIVHSVNPGGPAEIGGLREGDLILEINGHNVRNHCYQHVIELLKNSGSFPRLLVQGNSNVSSKPLQTNANSRLSFRKPKNTKKENLLRQKGELFKEQMVLRLTHKEQQIMHEALTTYLKNKDLQEFFKMVSSMLNEPRKVQLLHYLSHLLPQRVVEEFEKHAIDLMDKVLKEEKECVSILEDSINENTKNYTASEQDESFDILVDTLKVLNEDGDKLNGNDEKLSYLPNDSLITENDLKNIEKGSTLDLLLSMDKRTLKKLREDVIKMGSHQSKSFKENVTNGNTEFAENQITLSGKGELKHENQKNENAKETKYQYGVIEEDQEDFFVEPSQENFLVTVTKNESRQLSGSLSNGNHRNDLQTKSKYAKSQFYDQSKAFRKPRKHEKVSTALTNDMIAIEKTTPNRISEIANYFEQANQVHVSKDIFQHGTKYYSDMVSSDKPSPPIRTASLSTSQTKALMSNDIGKILRNHENCSVNYTHNASTNDGNKLTGIHLNNLPSDIAKPSTQTLNGCHGNLITTKVPSNVRVFQNDRKAFKQEIDNDNNNNNDIVDKNHQSRNLVKNHVNRPKNFTSTSKNVIKETSNQPHTKNILKGHFKPITPDTLPNKSRVLIPPVTSSRPLLVPQLNFETSTPNQSSTAFPSPPPLNELQHEVLPKSTLSTPPPPPPPLPHKNGEPPVNVRNPPPPPVAVTRNDIALKRLNWEKLSDAKLENTVWTEMKPSEKIINFNELEELFSTKPSVNLMKKKEKKKKKRERLLCSKKVLNLGILLGHLKLSTDEIYRAVMNVDHTILTDAHLQTMLTCAPDPNEAELFRKMQANDQLTDLSIGDEFTMKMLQIPNYCERLKLMLFKMDFNEKVKALQPDIECVLKACKELKESEKLKSILEVVLAAGNYMNKGHNRISSASGFKISFLPKLMSTKTCDNNSTLLHIIVKNILENKSEILLLNHDLKSVAQAAKVSSQMINQEINLLKKGMKELEDELFVSRDQQQLSNDRFAKVMSQFVNEAHHSFHELLTQYSHMQNDFKQLVEFFGDDYTKTTTEDFFGSFAIFLQHIETTKESLLKSRQQHKRRRPSRTSSSHDRLKNYRKRASLPACLNEQTRHALFKSNFKQTRSKTIDVVLEVPTTVSEKENQIERTPVSEQENSIVNGTASEQTNDLSEGDLMLKFKVLKSSHSRNNSVDDSNISELKKDSGEKKEFSKNGLFQRDETQESCSKEKPLSENTQNNSKEVSDILQTASKASESSLAVSKPIETFQTADKPDESSQSESCVNRNSTVEDSAVLKADVAFSLEETPSGSITDKASKEVQAVEEELIKPSLEFESEAEIRFSISGGGENIEISDKLTPASETELSNLNQDMEANKKLSLDEIAAKVASVPLTGSLSGSVRNNPPPLVSAWEITVDIDPDGNLSANQKGKPKSEVNSSPLSNVIVDTSKNLSSEQINDTSLSRPKSPKPPVSPKPKLKRLAKVEAKTRSDIAKENSGHIKTHVKDLETSLEAKNAPIEIKQSSPSTLKKAQRSHAPSLADLERDSIDETLEQTRINREENDRDDTPTNDVRHRPSITTTVSIDLTNQRSFSIGSVSSAQNEIEQNKEHVEESYHDSKCDNKNQIDTPPGSSPTTIKRGDTVRRAYDNVIKSSRALSGSPKFLDQVKKKLEDEKVRAEKPKLTRKITKHEQPLYALVMKETIAEYELQKEAVDFDDPIERKVTTLKDNSEERSYNESPDFLTIMHRKLKERAPGVTDEFKDVDPTRSKKQSVTEPLYTSVIRETLKNYSAEKEEHDRVRKLGISLTDGQDGRITPNFLSMLEENLLEMNLISHEESEDSELNTGLCDDEPFFAIVIKAALEDFRKKKRYKITSVTPSLHKNKEEGESLVSNETQDIKNPNEGEQSQSSSDISLTSEEVKQINQKYFSSVDRNKNKNSNEQDGKYLESGSKPLLPNIPSPDYKKSSVTIAMKGGKEKEEDSSFNHPHHIERPFWNDTDDKNSTESTDSSDATSPAPKTEGASKQVSVKRTYDRKRPKRSSLKKKESTGKLNNVSFLKQVEVIDEVVELDEDEKIVRKDLRSSESPLKGSPQTELKRKMTPYHPSVGPIDDEIFEEAEKLIAAKKCSVDENRDALTAQSFTAETEIVNSEILPENEATENKISNNISDALINRTASFASEKDGENRTNENGIKGGSESTDLNNNKSRKTSTQVKNVTLSRDTDGNLTLSKPNSNANIFGENIQIDLASINPDDIQEKAGEKFVDITFDLITTTDEDGNTTVELVAHGKSPLNIKLPNVKLKTGPVSPRRDLPPPPIDRSLKPTSPTREIKSIEDEYASVIKSNNAPPQIVPRESMKTADTSVITSGKGSASPDILNIDVRHGKDSLLRTIIPSPDYSPPQSPKDQKASFSKTKRLDSVIEENQYESVEETLNKPMNKSSSPLPQEKSLIKIIAVEELPLGRLSPRDIRTPPQNGDVINSSPVFSDNQNELRNINGRNESENVFTFNESVVASRSNSTNPLAPPLPDRAKKPIKKAHSPVNIAPPPPLPRSPNQFH